MGIAGDNVIEEWRDIVGYVGMYQVSNYGRIKSLSRLRSSGIGFLKEKIIKQTPDNRGYLKVTLRINNTRTGFPVHRLVGVAFIDNPNNLPQINHKDEIKSNNNSLNLHWITNRANGNYSKNKSAASQFPGVFLDKRYGTWYVRCQLNGKNNHLGTYDVELEAAKAYVDFCKKHNLNYSV